MRLRFHIILFAIICFLPVALHAQPYPGNNNKMLIDQIKGCAPFSFQVTHNACLVSGDCSALFRDPNTNAILKTVPFVSGASLQQDEPGPFILQIVTASSVNNDDLLLTAIENIKPSFEVYTCQSGSIQVKVTDLQYDHYIINGAGPEVTQDKNDPPFNYGFPMPYPANTIVSVRGVNDDMADNCADSVKTVRVATIPPVNISSVTVLDANAVEITHDAIASVQYRLMAATNSNSPAAFQLAKPVYDSPTNIETITTILPDINYYCFRLDIFSPCNNGTIVNPNVVCSINFDVVAQSNYNALSWTTGPGATGEALTRDNVLIPLTNADYDVTCNERYPYKLRANFGSATSTSMEKTVTAISTDPADKVDNISAVVDGSQVVLDWQQPPDFTASSYVLRKIVGPDSGPIANLNALTYTDNAYVPQACYTIEYDDVCGNPSGASVQACPIVLTHTLHDDNTIDLWWTPYFGWDQGVDHYEVYEDGTLIDSPINPATSSAPYKIPNDAAQQVHQYRVIAYPREATAPPIVVSASNTVEVVKAPNLFYPQAFVPGSALAENAKFKVFSQFTEYIEFKIFNRWGELMFYTTDLESGGWDGTYKGTPMPEGTYVFTAKITDFAGRTFNRSGTIVLLRKR